MFSLMITNLPTSENIIFTFFYQEFNKPTSPRSYRAIKYGSEKLHTKFEYLIDWHGVKEYYDEDGEICIKPV